LLIPNGELRVFGDILGDLGLFGVAPTFMPQIDRHLADMLAPEV
jgi:homoserine O-acetyltransferase